MLFILNELEQIYFNQVLNILKIQLKHFSLKNFQLNN